MKKKEFEEFCKCISEAEFRDYYNTHTHANVSQTFKLNNTQIYLLLDIYNIPRHTREQTRKLTEQTCLNRYGYISHNQSPEVKKTKEIASMKKYGTPHPRKNTQKNKEIVEKTKSTCKERYNVEYTTQVEEFKEKAKATMLKNHGVEHALQAKECMDKAKQTWKEHFGENIENPYQAKSVKNKKEAVYQKRYGVKNPGQMDHVKQASHSKEAIAKAHETRKKNGTYGKSKQEDRIAEKLSDLFTVHRQYSDERYPFACDFYLPERDIFIEFNGYYTHNIEWYDGDKLEHIAKITEWESKLEEHPMYKVAIDVWTKRDVKKRNTARDNNLNYVVFWNENDVDKWIADGCPDRQDWR